MKDVQILVLEAIDLTGGTGWTKTVQNAIMHLDDRVERVEGIVIKHQQQLEETAEIDLNEPVFIIETKTDKSN